MKKSEEYFLEVANSLNISKTASRLYISQQDLSNHIRRLENQYGEKLFYRKPRLSLTPYGDALKRSLEKILVIEQGLENEFREIHDGSVGLIRMGIHFTRSRSIFPNILPRFNQQYPNVNVAVMYDETSNLKNMLLSGELDIIFGVNTIAPPELVKFEITSEKIFLLISDFLMVKHFNNNSKKICDDSLINGADLREFTNIPFIHNHEYSKAQQIINAYLDEQGIQLNKSFISTDHYGNIQLAANGIYACFCPQMMLQDADILNTGKKQGERLNAFLIRDVDYTLQISLLCSKYAFMPQYLRTFIDIIKEETIKASKQYEYGLINN